MHQPINIRGLVPILLTATALTAALGSGASAGTYQKKSGYGNLPGTAQATAGIGSLTAITGTLASTITGSERTVAEPSTPDLFEIDIDGSGLFSATTYGLPTTLYNPELFLFNSSGQGVYFNDDIDVNTRQSMIVPPTALTPGLYYIGIGVFGAIPRTGTGASTDIFQDPVDGAAVGFTGLFGPTNSGALSQWNISSTDVETGSYTIGLTGASFAVAPEPSEYAALGLGILGLGALVLRARRRRTA